MTSTGIPSIKIILGLLVAVLFALVATRYCLQKLCQWLFQRTALKCPACGVSLYRTRRNFADRLINLFMPVHRYRCSSRECDWIGLRVQMHRTRGRR